MMSLNQIQKKNITRETSMQNLIAFLSHYKFLIVLVTAMFMYGCTEEYRQQREIKRMEHEVAAMIEEIPKILQDVHYRSFSSNLIEHIEKLPDQKRKLKWYNETINSFFVIDISSLVYPKQYKCVIRFDDFRGKFSTAVSKYEKSEYLTWWRRLIKSLDWKKRQWDRLKKAYDEEKDSTNVVPVPESILNRVRSLQYIVEEGLECDYYAEMTSNEYSWWSSKDRMTPEERETIQREFEAYLGRPIRTERQIYADSIRRMEARKKREKERAKKAGRVILVDGTK